MHKYEKMQITHALDTEKPKGIIALGNYFATTTTPKAQWDQRPPVLGTGIAQQSS